MGWEIHDERSLLALQGPNAAPCIQALTSSDLSSMYFSNFRSMQIAGIDCWVTRTGYTGEDGFEISVSAATQRRATTERLTCARAAGRCGR